MKLQKQKGILDHDYSADRKKKLELKFRLSVRAGIVAHAVGKYSTSTTGLKILDLGAAEGRTLVKISDFLPGNEFIGIEYSQELISSDLVLPENIALVRGDVTKLPKRLAPQAFDVVSALAVLEHLGTPLDAVREAYRVLKPEGLFIATCPVPTWDHISNKLGLLKEDHHEIDMDRRLMTNIVNDAGFDLLEYRKFMWAPISFLPYLYIPISPMFSIKCDQWIETIKILNWLFVNQVVIGRKPSSP